MTKPNIIDLTNHPSVWNILNTVPEPIAEDAANSTTDDKPAPNAQQQGH
jgi:hypothetical protein